MLFAPAKHVMATLGASSSTEDAAGGILLFLFNLGQTLQFEVALGQAKTKAEKKSS
jgi:hypothetical protein